MGMARNLMARSDVRVLDATATNTDEPPSVSNDRTVTLTAEDGAHGPEASAGKCCFSG